MGGKVEDYCVPLCHQGANGCHTAFDSYELEDKRDEFIELGFKLAEISGQTEKAERIIREQAVTRTK